MLRYYFAFLLVVGVAASVLTGRGSQAPASAHERVIALNGPANAEPQPLEAAEQTIGSAFVLQREWDGHFYAEPEINGTAIRMLVDTGATGIALSRDDARRAGIGISLGMPEVIG